MADELHISSIIVQARPEQAAAVAAHIAGLQGAEIHERVGDAKLIVTLETPGSHEILARMEEINSLPGVISTALVYHHWEPAESADNEVDHEAHPPQLSQG
jgi:nitrate reductase NapD